MCWILIVRPFRFYLPLMCVVIDGYTITQMYTARSAQLDRGEFPETRLRQVHTRCQGRGKVSIWCFFWYGLRFK